MLTDIGNETASGLDYGHCPVGHTPHRLASESSPCRKGVLIRAPSSLDPTPNTVCVWVGDSRVLASSNEDRGGMPVAPGEALFIPIDDLYCLWVVSTDDGQEVAWMAM